MQDFKSLLVWQKSHQLTLSIYRVTTKFPSEEKFGLISQMRRASSSIPSNIAEGCGREGPKELKRFLGITMGSATELEYQLLLSHDLAFLSQQDYQRVNASVIEVKKMLYAFIQKLKIEG